MAERTKYYMNIAGYTICFQVRHPLLSELSRDFLTENTACTLSICPTQADIDFERTVAEPGADTREDVLESLACYRKLAGAIYKDNAFVVHGAAFCVHGEGAILLAPSGTGKTTHLRRLHALLGDDLCIINGDKPIVRLAPDGTPIVYGTPFRGKEQYGGNLSVPLRHLCFVTRAQTNHTDALCEKEAVAPLLQQIYIPAEPAAVKAGIEFAGALLRRCKAWQISCNLSPEAAEVSYKTIFRP